MDDFASFKERNYDALACTFLPPAETESQRLLRLEKTDPILAPNKSRWSIYPTSYESLWNLYLDAVDSFWTPEEVNLMQDLLHWQKLDKDERFFISRVLGFFNTADGLVGENLAMRFYNDVQIP